MAESVWGYFSSSNPLYYNGATHSYCYNGTNESITQSSFWVGWDDNYPASNFATPPRGTELGS